MWAWTTDKVWHELDREALFYHSKPDRLLTICNKTVSVVGRRPVETLSREQRQEACADCLDQHDLREAGKR